MIVMKADASERDLELVLRRIESLGFRAHLSRGIERTVVGVVGDERQYEAEVFEELAGV